MLLNQVGALGDSFRQQEMEGWESEGLRGPWAGER